MTDIYRLILAETCNTFHKQALINYMIFLIKFGEPDANASIVKSSGLFKYEGKTKSDLKSLS